MSEFCTAFMIFLLVMKYIRSMNEKQRNTVDFMKYNDSTSSKVPVYFGFVSDHLFQVDLSAFIVCSDWVVS